MQHECLGSHDPELSLLSRLTTTRPSRRSSARWSRCRRRCQPSWRPESKPAATWATFQGSECPSISLQRSCRRWWSPWTPRRERWDRKSRKSGGRSTEVYFLYRWNVVVKIVEYAGVKQREQKMIKRWYGKGATIAIAGPMVIVLLMLFKITLIDEHLLGLAKSAGLR